MLAFGRCIGWGSESIRAFVASCDLLKETWHKLAIWVTMSSLMAASISVCFVF
jgi:hypothetical protein